MNLENLTDALSSYIPYSDQSVDYPDLSEVKPNDGVEPEWFYPAILSNDHSEPVAINQYIGQKALFSDISELMFGIALVEMRHYDSLMELIRALGGELKFDVKPLDVKIGESIIEALKNDIEAEKNTIEFYQELKLKIDVISVITVTINVVSKLLDKLIADEQHHLYLLREELEGIEENE